MKIIYLIDDEESVRRSVGLLLETYGYEVVPYPCGIDFLREKVSLPRGCILLDVRMPDQNGLEIQSALAADGDSWPVVILTGHGDVVSAVAAMRRGAIDFIEKPFATHQLFEALDRAFDKFAVDEAVHTAKSRIEALTGREREVFDALTEGLSNKQVARKLDISSRTVEAHRAHIMEKLGANNLVEMVRMSLACR
ncbi:response regulator transcription factor [Sphingomonas spermidinifaciens]|nr:response regulator [Sphingomonas spermidinifaciens]